MIKLQYGVGMQIIAPVFFTNQIADNYYFPICIFSRNIGRVDKYIIQLSS